MDMNLPQANPMIERPFDSERAVIERAVIERASMEGKTRLGPIVNPARWAEQVVSEQACQNQADTKAFKGRGKLLELRQLLTELDRTVDAMKEVVEVTKQVQDAQMYLMLHIKTATGLTFLRWRERNGACRHVPWPEVQERIAAFDSDVGDWYANATERALALNEHHKDLRRAIATARKVVMRSAPTVYARSIAPRQKPHQAD